MVPACGDDGGSSNPHGGETSTGSGTGPLTSGPATAESSSSGVADDSGTDDGSPLCDEPPPQGKACGAPSSTQFGYELLVPEEARGVDPQDAVCRVYGVVEQGPLGDREIGLWCDLPAYVIDFIVTVRLQLPDEITTPLRPGMRVHLSAESVGLGGGTGWNFALRDDDGALALMGIAHGDLRTAPELLAPFVVEPERGVCGFVEQQIGDCISAVAPFQWTVTHGEEELTVLDGDVATLESVTFLSNAVEYFAGCPECATAPQWSATMLGSPRFDAPPVEHCDPFGDDCPKGERCVAASETPGLWDATTCVPSGTLGEGEPCDVPDPTSPTDDCAHGLVCVAGADTAEATCRPQCEGSLDDPQCATGTECTLDAAGMHPPLACVPTCDPVAQNCADPTDACVYAGDAGFVCASPGTAGVAEDCDNIFDCSPGLLCANPKFVPACFGGTLGCCAEYCSLAAPACSAGTECASLFSELPPGYEDLGLCVDPEAYPPSSGR